MTHFNSSKIIQEAEAVISEIEIKLIRQSGYKLGDAEINIDKNRQSKIDKLNSLVHYVCYLEKQNDQYFSTFANLQDRIRVLEYTINDLQKKANVDKKIQEL